MYFYIPYNRIGNINQHYPVLVLANSICLFIFHTGILKHFHFTYTTAAEDKVLAG